MQNFSLNLLKIIMVSLCVISTSSANQAQKYEQQKSLYFNMCSSLARPNVDCTCVAKAHATYSHLSPNQQYADFLIETYKNSIGMPNKKDEAFERYLAGRNSQVAQIEIYNAFSEYERYDPFYEEVNGCVIDKQPKVDIPPLPTEPIFKQVYDYRVNSTGTQRLERCILNETSKVLNSDELAALHYVYYRGVNATILQNKLGLAEQEAKLNADKASKKFENYQNSVRNVSNYCAALLAPEELSTGTLIQRFVRDAEQRAGAPVGLESIDINIARGNVSNKFGDEVAALQAEVDNIKRDSSQQNQGKEAVDSIKNSDAIKQAQALMNTKAMSATETLLSEGCTKAGQTKTYCDCFVDNFLKEIGEEGGAAALPVIADGISDTQTMSLMKNINQATYMQDVMTAQAISARCEG
ncbi:hypothetical protein [Glaciecola petra]|uniref:Secreted protein n=1 Tax=Glaciecola petra TaxID=3075602 RepID=A0ABU2ZPV7_9ALTE|nr:hypothetical protein [Aestuariibacter sp. P117]MDT0594659.1 hypothetical protein [Aestuariibacter sp. P117]